MKNEMAQRVFNRYEKKFLIDEMTYQEIRSRLEKYMQVDDYGWHNIRNLYYDTDTDELIRTSIEKPQYKEKFRVRCYGQPTADTSYFLEIKKKYKGLVNKRRINLNREEADTFLQHNGVGCAHDQIEKEISYFLQHYEVHPKLYLAYDRIALFGKDDKDFRVTFDKNIRSREENLTLDSDEDTMLLLKPGTYLMEVKISNAMPLWFVDILSTLNVRSCSFSKYGNIYKNSRRLNYVGKSY